MKLRALLAAVFVAGLAVSVAIAAPAEKGKGRNGTTAAETSTTGGDTGTTTTGETGHKGKGKKGHGKRECRPNRAAVLVGDFAGAGDASFAMAVKGGNRVGKKLAGKQVTVSVVDGTKIRRSGKAKLADLKAGDLLLVQGRACKLDTQALTLVAKMVVVLSPSDDEDEDTDEGTTSTSTSTEQTSTSTTES